MSYDFAPFAVIMTGCVASGALLLVAMAALTLCHPYGQAVGLRSFPSSHFRPGTLLQEPPKQKFTPHLSVSGARTPIVKEDATHVAKVWAHGNEQQVLSGAENVPDAVDMDEQLDASGGVAVPQLPVSGGPDMSGFGPIHPQPAPYPQLHFQPGELLCLEKTFEHGDYESEREAHGIPQQPRPQPLPVPFGSTPQSVARFPPGFVPPYVSVPYVPYPFAYFFLTGRYPPGAATHFSSNFEHGTNYNQDLDYEKDEPIWPWVDAAGPPQNTEQAVSQGSVLNDGLESGSSYYSPLNQPDEVKVPHYYSPLNHPDQVKISPRYFRSRVEY
ncbi:uncharacterized protein LOC109523471 isoform X2 [Hippocampus comes]|uniref:uncharacterized protein LOC109523471 isoform X1 n=1 Tax=Hippocampus comes TaxID=109280 RepID=UPI00094EFB04|nr:PREDICTED: uncharacterized protein LOC109523471 isoform X1 [Hippocampus comes]XP_019738206.1 PREDICTED: uncharacterized protein LOC109523471 isoform X2 [Hippocampus comes]